MKPSLLDCKVAVTKASVLYWHNDPIGGALEDISTCIWREFIYDAGLLSYGDVSFSIGPCNTEGKRLYYCYQAQHKR
jgi:hypothetical protein